MAKKLMEDMKSKGVKITQISKEDVGSTSRKTPIHKEDQVTPEKNREETKLIKSIYERETSQKISSTPKIKREKNGTRSIYKILLGVAILVGAVFYIGNLFQSAKINVVAKRDSFVFSGAQLTASNDESTPIHFELMIVSNEDYKDVTLSKPETVSKKAKGEITFFNEYSTKAQTIIAKTFVSDPSGKTYETDKAISIPGYKTLSGVIIAGQVSVPITASLPGDVYNGAPNDFVINAFKGTLKEKKIYAKLKAPLTGGAEGVVYALGPNEKGLVHAVAESSFKSNLIKKVNAEVPAGYLLYPNAMSFSYASDDESLFKTANAKVRITGTMSAIIIKQKDISDALIKNKLPNISPNEFKEIQVSDIASLVFNFSNQNQAITKDLKSLNFNLTGTAKATWAPDVETLRSSVKGVRKENLVSIFKNDPGIASASARIFPPWQAYVPDDLTKIHVEVK